MTELQDVIKVQSRPQAEGKAKIEDLIKQYNVKKTERQLITNTIQLKNKDAGVLKTEIENANEKYVFQFLKIFFSLYFSGINLKHFRRIQNFF